MPLGQNHNHPLPDQDNDLRHQHLPPSSGHHWDSELRRPLDRCEFSPKTRPAESQGLSPGHRLPDRRTPDTEAHNPLGYGSINRPLDHRVCSPDRLTQGSSTQRFPASHGGQGTNGEDGVTISREVSPVRPQMTTTVRLSPPRTQRDFQHQVGYMETGLDKITSPTEVTRNRSKNMLMDKCPITCDLCDVEVANAQELEDHLESKTHWDTLEHIQLQNNYDDMAIAFLQEVMLYKSHQSSRAIDNSALQALEENDHMTKVEIFHCASCKVFVSTAAASVQAHITSQEHLSNTKEFEMHQRRDCLQKAETIMKELEPQFEHFLKGGSPFQ
ncbi:DBIRD complex subunit ZNF326-like [Pempheris klunzingeri]|uniref:DBIRD complex subunit ZNF326-like n=1 Tax=Pempheris klunzingeri TaxID=3127111 RepID=UPI00397EF6E2